MAGVVQSTTALVCLAWAIHALGGEPQASVPPGGDASAHSLPGADKPANAPVPALPGTRTPIDDFRELLAMTPTERAQALADKTEDRRKHLVQGLREYEVLSPHDRELRLTQLEFRWHLLGLMKLAPTNRAPRLQLVPVKLRKLTEDRLKEWDLLPPDLQRKVLDQETTSSYFLRPSSGPLPPSVPSPAFGPPPLPAPRAGALTERVAHLLELPAEGEKETLHVLSEAERADMDKTLREFERLGPDQRRNCVDAFEKLKRMSDADRQQFLKNAERWKAMSPAERETWRSLLRILPPGRTVSNPPPLPAPVQSPPPITASNSSSQPGK